MKDTTNKNGSVLGERTQATASGIAFSIASILPTVLSVVFLLAIGNGDYSQADWYIYVSYLLPQIAFAVTAIWFLYYAKIPIGKAFADQKCKPRYFLIALLLQVGLFSLSELNAWFLSLLHEFGYQDFGIRLPSMEDWGFFGVLLVVAALPAIFEEIMFRGVLLNGLKSFGEMGSVLLCGALFALYHQNPAQTLYQFCCGVAFAFIAVRSGSVLPTVLAHFFNNALILCLAKFGIESIPVPVMIAVLLVSAVCLIVSLVWLCVFDKKKQVETETCAKTPLDRADRKRFLLCALIGITVCALTWLMVLFSGL